MVIESNRFSSCASEGAREKKGGRGEKKQLASPFFTLGVAANAKRKEKKRLLAVSESPLGVVHSYGCYRPSVKETIETTGIKARTSRKGKGRGQRGEREKREKKGTLACFACGANSTSFFTALLLHIPSYFPMQTRARVEKKSKRKGGGKRSAQRFLLVRLSLRGGGGGERGEELFISALCKARGEWGREKRIDVRSPMLAKSLTLRQCQPRV